MAASTSNKSIVIVGAGIIGLDVALVLAEREFGPSITVVAEYLPGDTAVTYTSPWAGCNFSAISGSDANALKWDSAGYSHLMRLANNDSEASFVKRTPSIEMWDEDIPENKIKDMSKYLEDFRVLPAEELPRGVRFAVGFTTVTINAPKHIEYLYNKLRNQHGVTFIRQKLPTILAAFADPATKLVFNCTGNASRALPGVEDARCYPTRGQVVLVRAPNVHTNVMRHGKDYETYVIPRPQSNGNVVLGGYMQKGREDGSTYGYETEDILNRANDLSSELKAGGREVLAVSAGMRPSRQGGARVERSMLEIGGKKRNIVHNYGAGGTGFQAGYGMAVEAVNSAADVLRELSGMTRSRL